jgi:hypothetical protein
MVVRPRGSQFLDIGSQMVVRLSTLRAGRTLPPGRFLVLISVSASTNYATAFPHSFIIKDSMFLF